MNAIPRHSADFHDRMRRNDASDTARQLVVWCPDWPVVAAAAPLGLSLQLPLAVFDHGEVFACSAMARVEGVRRGMRRRDASARCPELTVLERNPASEIRTFEDCAVGDRGDLGRRGTGTTRTMCTSCAQPLLRR